MRMLYCYKYTILLLLCSICTTNIRQMDLSDCQASSNESMEAAEHRRAKHRITSHPPSLQRKTQEKYKKRAYNDVLYILLSSFWRKNKKASYDDNIKERNIESYPFEHFHPFLFLHVFPKEYINNSKCILNISFHFSFYSIT